MDRRLLIGVVVVVLGGIMGKRVARTRPWLVLCEFIGGPMDGERPELQAEGTDPHNALICAAQSGDIESRIQMDEYWYKLDWSSVRTVGAGANSAVTVKYVAEGLDL